MSAENHARLEKIEVGDVGVATLKFAHVFDIAEFIGDKGVVRIAFAMDESEHLVAFFPAILASEPSGGLG